MEPLSPGRKKSPDVQELASPKLRKGGYSPLGERGRDRNQNLQS